MMDDAIAEKEAKGYTSDSEEWNELLSLVDDKFEAILKKKCLYFEDMVPAFGRRKANSPDAVQESNEAINLEDVLPNRITQESSVDLEVNSLDANRADQQDGNAEPDDTSVDRLLAAIDSPRFASLDDLDDPPETTQNIGSNGSSEVAVNSATTLIKSTPRQAPPRKGPNIDLPGSTHSGRSKSSRINSGPATSVLANHLPSRDERDAEWDFKKKHMLAEQAARKAEVISVHKLSDAITKSLNPEMVSDWHTQSIQEIQLKKQTLEFNQAELDFKERNLDETKTLKRRREKLELDKIEHELASQNKKAKMEDISMRGRLYKEYMENFNMTWTEAKQTVDTMLEEEV